MLLDIFFFLIVRLLEIEPISLASFVSVMVLGLALFLLDEESLLAWIKKKLNNT